MRADIDFSLATTGDDNDFQRFRLFATEIIATTART